MKRAMILRMLCAAPFVLLMCNAQAGTPEAPKRPLFEPNKGQLFTAEGKPASHALLRTEGHGMNMYVTRTGLSYVFAERLDRTAAQQRKEGGLKPLLGKDRTPPQARMAWAHMRLEGATIREENIILEEEGAARYDYYLTSCPQGVSTHKYGRVTIREVYPGIDWLLYTNGDGVKYDFIVHPHGDAGAISMVYQSEEPVLLDDTGMLTIRTAMGSITEQAPVSFWQANGRPVASKFTKQTLDAHRVRVRFAIDTKDAPANSALVIDPILTWGTFTRTDNWDGVMTIKTKSNGDVIVAGYGGGGTGLFPVPFDTLNFSGAYTSGSADWAWQGFLQAFSNTGVLLWSTVYAQIDQPLQLSIDPDDRIILAGVGFTDMPTMEGTGSFAGAFYSATSADGLDGMIIGFTPNGVREWATFLGGGAITSISTSPTGRIVLIGDGDAGGNIDLPGTGSFAGAFHLAAADTMAMLYGFEPNGAMSWASGWNMPGWFNKLIAFRNTEEFVLTGYAKPQLPTLAAGSFSGATVIPSDGTTDGYIAGFSPNGEQLWGSFFGLDEATEIHGLDIGPDNRAVVMAVNLGDTFTPLATGVFEGAYQNYAPGSADIVLLGFNAGGQLQWKTQLGGTSDDYSTTVQQVAFDPCGSLFVSFEIGSFTPSEPLPLPIFGGCNSYLDGVYGDGVPNNISGPDIALMRFTPNGALTWSTLWGAHWQEFRSPVTAGPNGELYMTGETESTGHDLVDAGNGAWFMDETTVTDNDSYILRFTPTPCDGIVSCTPFYATATNDLVTCPGDCDGTVTATGMNGTAPFTFLWENGQTTATATGLCPGQHTCTVTDANGQSVTVTTVVQEPQPMEVFFWTAGGVSDCLQPTGTLAVNIIYGGITNGLGYPAGYDFAWAHSNLDTAYFEAMAPGAYPVTITDQNGCAKQDTAYIAQMSQPIMELSVADSILGAGESTLLTASGAIAYTWTPSTGLSCANCAQPTASPTDTTTYCVMGIDINGCSDTLCVTIFATPPCTGVYVPTAFSPDGSTKNDLHCVYGNCIGSMEMNIYDRWGKLVFTSTNADRCWDGTFEGKALSAGVFVYSLTGTLTDGQVVDQQGNITLIR
ncbi:MAG TPA: gliding motility-associated C-terminal domain-containing protein [Flavobacteriales bacterium]